MVELGIDVWQGVLPENDIVKLQKQLHGRMTLMQTAEKKEQTRHCPQARRTPSVKAMTKMGDEGLAYEDVLKDAQAKGFAEADPTADVEGIDVANKLSILMALAFGKYVPPSEIPTVGITGVTMSAIVAPPPQPMSRIFHPGCQSIRDSPQSLSGLWVEFILSSIISPPSPSGLAGF